MQTGCESEKLSVGLANVTLKTGEGPNNWLFVQDNLSKAAEVSVCSAVKPLFCH
jgi:hypothetical protein